MAAAAAAGGAMRTVTKAPRRIPAGKSNLHARALISCINGLGCENKSCRRRVHGVFDPNQQAFFNACPLDKQGVAACLYGLFGYCPLSHLCRYRHYTMIRPLTPEQIQDAVSVLVRSGALAREVNTLQKPMVVWPIAESLKQQRLQLSNLVPPGAATHPFVAGQLKVIERLMELKPMALWVTSFGGIYMTPIT